MQAKKVKTATLGGFSIVDMFKDFYNQSMKKNLFLSLSSLFFLAIPLVVLARVYVYNGTVTAKAADGTLTLTVDRGTDTSGVNGTLTYTVKPTTGTYSVNDDVTFSVNLEVDPPTVVASTLKKGTNTAANGGVGSTTNPSTFRLFPTLSCPDENLVLSCWMNRVWTFAQTAILLLSISAFVVAGVLYMTSAGNPKQIEKSKKIMLGALSAVAVIVLGKFFLENVIGIQWR